MTTSGSLAIVGLGPGPLAWTTPEVSQALARANDLVGYGPYLDRVPACFGQMRHNGDNGDELARAVHALRLAAEGRHVAVVSSGDPGIFAMAAAVFEAVEKGDQAWRSLDIRVLPGVSAMQAVAARLGAPLGHDFCVISLSDNLKPWSVIERRLIAACEGDFVVAFYNPASKARPNRIYEAFDILRVRKAATTPVALARAIGRPGEHIALTSIADADLSTIDMSTLVLVGSSETRLVARTNGRPWLLSPRSYGAGR
jgi:precorrin-3B C17-methyltransferase